MIELMVVMAIIGLLAAIAIPNFMSYRNKSFCSKVETDANSVASAIATYYSIPNRVSCIDHNDPSLSGIINATQNRITIICSDPNKEIKVMVSDASGRCPQEYRAALSSGLNPSNFWTGLTFVKVIQ